VKGDTIPQIEVREECAGDERGIRDLHAAAFGQLDEGAIVDRVRGSGGALVSLVASSNGAIVGHVLISSVRIEGEGAAPPVGGLGPISVDPDMQGRSVGSTLMRAALARAPRHGWKALFLLGDPAYCVRFGFEPAPARGFHYESERYDAAFQLLELEPGALTGCRGWVRYHPAFAGD